VGWGWSGLWRWGEGLHDGGEELEDTEKFLEDVRVADAVEEVGHGGELDRN